METLKALYKRNNWQDISAGIYVGICLTAPFVLGAIYEPKGTFFVVSYLAIASYILIRTCK